MEDNSADYFIWRSTDRSRTVRIVRDVMKQLHIEVMRGFGKTRRRGTECGGVLLGSTGSEGEVTVESFSVVPCEYAFGPSYQLSGNDEVLFREAVENAGESAIGYFRSHTRDDLGIEHADAALFSNMLDGRGRVALLLKPFATKPPAASFFFPGASGVLSTSDAVSEFVFSPKLAEVIEELPTPPVKIVHADAPRSRAATASHGGLAAETAVITSVQAIEVSAPAAVRPAVAPAAGPEVRPQEASSPDLPVTDALPSFGAASQQVVSQRGWLTALLGILFVASALMTGVLGGFQVAGGRIRIAPEFRIERPDPARAYVIGLHAVPAGDRIRLSWPSDSYAVRTATGGTLTITDGAGEVRGVPLPASEVREGVILHAPASDRVRFRLELSMPDHRSVSETLDWAK